MGVTLCHTQSTYQIGKSTSTPCVTKSDFSFRISSERGGGTSLQHNCNNIDELSSTHKKKILSFNVLNDLSHSAKVTCNVQRIRKGGRGWWGVHGQARLPAPQLRPCSEGSYTVFVTRVFTGKIFSHRQYADIQRQ